MPAVFGGQIYLRLDGIPGEAADVGHSEWIEIQSFQEGVSRPIRSLSPAFSAISLTKFLDKATPALALHAINGHPIASGSIEVLRSGATQLRFLQVKLTNITVLALSEKAAAGNLPTDSFSLNFSTVEWTYTQFDAGGRPLTNIICSWNRQTGTGVGGEPIPDQDGDGLPDDYERLYGLNPALNDADADADNDGVSNIDEFRAGTFPNRADSVFRVTGRRTATGQVVLNWNPVAGKTYSVLSASSPEGPYTFVRELDDASVARGEVTFEAVTPRLFYIIEVQ
ncbi:MAG: uncharacterized protein JWM99_154 [Verrucomicrobiales bacterium]|nr:uncharacterized protein [Verrucomicrobiales bacterium]